MPFRGPEQYANEQADLLITDFESGTSDEEHLLLARVASRDGAWILGQDGTSHTLTDQASMDCAARDRWAGHFAGSGFTNWWANWTAVFKAYVSTPVPYDGRGYSAVSFWAGFGGKNGPPFEVPVGIVTVDTAFNSGVGYVNPPVCNPCTDHYMTTVPLTRDWQRYVVHFDDMKQDGRGVPQVPMRRDQLVGFIIWPRQQFDIWIDDIRFKP
jgi:hypothetical protein